MQTFLNKSIPVVIKKSLLNRTNKNWYPSQVHPKSINSKIDVEIDEKNPLRIIIAGGGLGGLFAAICLLNAGMEVTVLEKTSNYRPLGGPIQLASNGIGTVKLISERLYKGINNVARPFWGTESGIRDGLTSEWMFKFDAITELPCDLNLPFSICIDRSDLQSELLTEIGQIGKKNAVHMASMMKSYEINSLGEVIVHLSDSIDSPLIGDILIGADGIWSQTRSILFDEPLGSSSASSTASFTGFKLFSGLPQFASEDLLEIGYCAYIGPDNYFVICPDKGGRVQWYAFMKSLPGSVNKTEPVEYLLGKFADWNPMICNLIKATNFDEVTQRDLWDRSPIIRRDWSKDCVTLLGDSCHATMPNIGQGCGLAFEDGYILSLLLKDMKTRREIPQVLKKFYRKRIFRTAVVQGLGRLNSEAIKLLTPLLPYRRFVDTVLTPFLPLVFRLQFWYCYSFCPINMDVDESLEQAKHMKEKFKRESKIAWKSFGLQNSWNESLHPHQ